MSRHFLPGAFSAQRFTFSVAFPTNGSRFVSRHPLFPCCVPPPSSTSIFCTMVHVLRCITDERFTCCVPPPASRTIFCTTVHVSRCISGGRVAVCADGDELPTNGSRFVSLRPLPGTTSAQWYTLCAAFPTNDSRSVPRHHLPQAFLHNGPRFASRPRLAKSAGSLK